MPGGRAPVGVDVGETKHVLERANEALLVNVHSLGKSAVNVEHDKVHEEVA